MRGFKVGPMVFVWFLLLGGQQYLSFYKPRVCYVSQRKFYF